MSELIIFGCGQIAEVIHYYLTQEGGHQIAAFTVDAERMERTSLFGLPVVPFETVQNDFPPERFGIFVAIGYGRLNAPRAAKLAEAEAKGYRAIGHISPRAVTPAGFVAPPNSFVMEHNTLQPFASIGRNTILWSGNHVGHHSHIGDNCFIASHVVVSGGVRVGDNSFIGVNATLRDNITVGSHCVIGAGALIMADAADYSVYPGQATEAARIRSDRLRW